MLLVRLDGASGLEGFYDDNYGVAGICTTTPEDAALVINALGLKEVNLFYGDANISGNSLDIQNSLVEKIRLTEAWRCKNVYLPSTCNYIDLENCGGNFECSSSHFSLKIRNNVNRDFSFKLKSSSLGNVVVDELDFVGQSMDSSWKNVTIEKLQLRNYNHYLDGNYGDFHDKGLLGISLDCINSENLTNKINQLYLSNVKYNSLSELDKFTITTDIHSWYNGLTSFGDFFEKNKVITKLYLTHNNIKSLDGIEKAEKLEYLDLSYNTSLGNNYTSSIDGQNKIVTEVISNLPNLKWISLEGNTDITDFSYLTSKGFKNTGNNVFIKE